MNTEPVVGAQLPRAQALPWVLWEADWDERKMQARRLHLLREDPTTAPTSKGVLVIDETGDRKDGHKTAHVGRQYLGKLGKLDNGVVCVTSLWADEEVYSPVDFEAYTPAHHFPTGCATRGTFQRSGSKPCSLHLSHLWESSISPSLPSDQRCCSYPW